MLTQKMGEPFEHGAWRYGGAAALAADLLVLVECAAALGKDMEIGSLVDLHDVLGTDRLALPTRNTPPSIKQDRNLIFILLHSQRFCMTGGSTRSAPRTSVVDVYRPQRGVGVNHRAIPSNTVALRQPQHRL